ncbi:hypothetical protein [Deinococcus depolymerans]|uniref:hypothetical protein n=1 Tax=Deinococcus depolymerans TaxID=392408 RepID=UPI0031D952E8
MRRIVVTLMLGAALTGTPAAGGTALTGVGVVTPMADAFWTSWRLIASDRSWWDGHMFCRWQREYVQFSPQSGEYVVRQTQTTVTGGYPCPAP